MFKRRATGILYALAGLPLFNACGVSPPPNFAAWPLNQREYQLEPWPVLFTASYAREDDIFVSLTSGEVLRYSDSDPTRPPISLGRPDDGGAKLLFASREGTVFAGAFGRPVRRSTDGGQTWETSLDTPCWRMDEDDQGALYAGNYGDDAERMATVYKSVDQGATWSTVFQQQNNRHIHTVRWDDISKRVYIAFGDAADRGQAFSEDGGATFHILAQGPREGHTDLALCRDCTIWCSDDQSGRLFRVDRRGRTTRTLTEGTQFMWFGVGRGDQVFVGTVTSQPEGGDRACLLASSDDGLTWQKLLESDPSTGPYDKIFDSESRELSAGGWLYFTGDVDGQARSYRVRHVSN